MMVTPNRRHGEAADRTHMPIASRQTAVVAPAETAVGEPEDAPAPSLAPRSPEDALHAVVVEALRCLDDPMELERLTPLVRLRAVQERAARQYHDGWCASGRALRDLLRAAVEPVTEVLPPQAAEMLRILAAGGAAAEAARRLGVSPPALRKRATPQIEAALVRYFTYLERGAPL